MSSGYSERYRAEVITAGIQGFNNQCKRADDGEVTLHRPRNFNREDRKRRKIITKTSWYKPNDSVIFIPSTPGSILARQYREVINNELKDVNISVKVVETSGVSMTRQVSRTDTSGCLIPDCPLCECDRPGASHTRSGAEYQATCLVCKNNGTVTSYEGETGHNAAYRLSQHVTDIKKKSKKWALSRHLTDMHPDKSDSPDSFEFKCIKTFKKPLDRQCFEGVMINRSTADIRLNSKSEFHQPSEIRVITTRSSEETSVTSRQTRNLQSRSQGNN